MKKLGKTKLRLDGETIRALSSDNLVQANGGGLLTLICNMNTMPTRCDVPSVTCSIVGVGLECGSKIG